MVHSEWRSSLLLTVCEERSVREQLCCSELPFKGLIGNRFSMKEKPSRIFLCSWVNFIVWGSEQHMLTSVYILSYVKDNRHRFISAFGVLLNSFGWKDSSQELLRGVSN